MRDGEPIIVPEGSKRLLVFLALNRGRVDRRHAVGALWPEGGDADKAVLALHPDVEVDVDSLSKWAARLIEGNVHRSDLRVGHLDLDALDLLHGLEALSRHLLSSRRWSEAVEAAMTAVSVEPLRESAQRALVDAHLAEGNLVEARRSFARYSMLLRAELDVEPGVEFASMADRRGLIAHNGAVVAAPPEPLAAGQVRGVASAVHRV